MHTYDLHQANELIFGVSIVQEDKRGSKIGTSKEDLIVDYQSPKAFAISMTITSKYSARLPIEIATKSPFLMPS